MQASILVSLCNVLNSIFPWVRNLICTSFHWIAFLSFLLKTNKKNCLFMHEKLYTKEYKIEPCGKSKEFSPFIAESHATQMWVTIIPSDVMGNSQR